MITYWTCSPVMPDRSSAALMAKAPSSAPEKPFREPSSRPIGVRAPATITEVVLVMGRAPSHVVARWRIPLNLLTCYPPVTGPMV